MLSFHKQLFIKITLNTGNNEEIQIWNKLSDFKTLGLLKKEEKDDF